MYQVILDNRVRRDLSHLPSDVLARLVRGLQMLAQNPRPRGARRLTGTDGWRVRIGSYRILYLVDDKRRVVVVYRLAHRKDVYR
jgi:mRNA interferase RelE/StbE